MKPDIEQINKELIEAALDDPVRSLEKAYQALDESTRQGSKAGQAESLLNIGRCLIFSSRFDEADEPLQKALDLFRGITGNETLMGELRTLNAMGVRAFKKSDYETALDYYFSVLTQSDQIGNIEIQAAALNNISEIHRLLGNNEEALIFAHRANVLIQAKPESVFYAITLINLGECYLKIEDYDIAEEYFTKSLDATEKGNNIRVKADALLGLGRVLISRSNYAEAEEKIAAAAELYRKTSNKTGSAECSYRRATIRIKESKLSEAWELIKAAEAAAEELDSRDLIRRCKWRSYQIKKAENNIERALEFLEKHHALELEQRNDSLKNRLKKITILYETEQSETEKEAYRMESMELHKKNSEIHLINEIGKEITSSFDSEEIVYNAYNGLKNLLDMSSFGIALYDEKQDILDFHYFFEDGNRIEPFSVSMKNKNSLSVWSIINNEPILVGKRSDAKKFVKKWERGTGIACISAVFIPIRSRDKLIGCLTAQSMIENAYNRNHLDILGAASSFIAIALDNSKNHNELNKLNEIITNEKKGLETAYEKIAYMANHDPLTDLPNRHLLYELLEQNIGISRREGKKMAVLYMDLDGFKPINDHYGHDFGDLVLKMSGERINAALRSSDTVARVGGDEFVAVLQNSPGAKGIRAAADKIIKNLGEEIKLGGQSLIVGVSVGIAVFPEDGETLNSLLLNADKAMYKAKSRGRNRAVFFKD